VHTVVQEMVKTVVPQVAQTVVPRTVGLVGPHVEQTRVVQVGQEVIMPIIQDLVTEARMPVVETETVIEMRLE